MLIWSVSCLLLFLPSQGQSGSLGERQGVTLDRSEVRHRSALVGDSVSQLHLMCQDGGGETGEPGENPPNESL